VTRPYGARKRALLTVERLRAIYPAETELDFRNPWELLVATILSAQSTDKTVNRIMPLLLERWPTPATLAAADPTEVERLIMPTGFFREKTKSIMGASRALVERFGGEVPPRMEDLITLPGVGRKTANVVLGAAFGVPGFAVDTHVKRLCNRLRLTDSQDPIQIEKDVCEVVPPEEWTGLSLRLILHGRRICDARRPLCEQCVLNDFCPSSLTRPSNKRSKIRLGESAGGPKDQRPVPRAAL